MIIQTNENILTKLDLVSTNYLSSRSRWDITYKLIEISLIGGNELNAQTITCIISDPAEIDSFLGSFSTIEELIAQSEAKALEHSGITEWDGTIIDDIVNDPNASDVRPWVPGELLAPPNVVRYNDVNYDVLQPHTALAIYPPGPNTQALYNESLDQDPGGSAIPAWSAPQVPADAYPIGFRVYHDNPNDDGNLWVYESLIPANTTEPGRDGTFDRYWEPIELYIP